MKRESSRCTERSVYTTREKTLLHAADALITALAPLVTPPDVTEAIEKLEDAIDRYEVD